MTDSELAKVISGKIIKAKNVELSSLEYDSREVKAGSAFFCFPGVHVSGAAFIGEAIQNGALAIVTVAVPSNIDPNVSYILLQDNIRVAYAKASSAFFSHPSAKLKCLGVTGTDGKTSTAYFTYQLLKAFGRKTALVSTVYTDDGTGFNYSPFRQSTPEAFPLNALLSKAVKNGAEFAVIEATSHALSNELDRLAGISYEHSAYTKISSEHLEFHKTLEEYIEAKCNLARRTKGAVFVYEDNKALEEIKKCSDKVVLLECPAILTQSEEGLEFVYNDKIYTLPFFESYMLQNAFEAASLVSKSLSYPLCEVLAKLASLRAPEGRSKRIQNSSGRNIIIDFAHTGDSFISLFSEYRKLYKNGSFIAVFGAAGERDKSKRSLLGLAASRYCSILIITEEDPRGESDEAIYEELISAIPEEQKRRIKLLRIDEREEAIKKALELSAPGDTIFLLGKGHETSIEKNGIKYEYSESATLSKVLSRCCCEVRKSENPAF